MVTMAANLGRPAYPAIESSEVVRKNRAREFLEVTIAYVPLLRHFADDRSRPKASHALTSPTSGPVSLREPVTAKFPDLGSSGRRR
jgi:hypothetical protein